MAAAWFRGHGGSHLIIPSPIHLTQIKHEVKNQLAIHNHHAVTATHQHCASHSWWATSCSRCFETSELARGSMGLSPAVVFDLDA
ncbi:hypothetical protein Hypma_004559 [Hypsizygus marmoreus]|uniref:Uncharacterized protein n=1 Tax=Hypsizygus marmoreus TaxID=39966 RepID=A0A369J1W8_HYPMA|nr:hypothetical protein Hypma_004559 [Hypsizygus marmoreus]